MLYLRLQQEWAAHHSQCFPGLEEGKMQKGKVCSLKSRFLCLGQEAVTFVEKTCGHYSPEEKCAHPELLVGNWLVLVKSGFL